VRRALAALLAAAAGGAAAAGAAGCQTHACDASTTVVDGGTSVNGGNGELAMEGEGGPVVWESAPLMGKWLDYPPSGTITFNFPKTFVNVIAPDAGSTEQCPYGNYQVLPYVSTAQDQDASGATSTPASGQLAQITDACATGFSITNNTCSEYFLRVVVVPETAYVPVTVDAAARDAHE
jgi:hypothetical protein